MSMTIFAVKLTRSPTNFVKLYSVFQKLDHLTCNVVGALLPDLSGAIRTLGLTGGNKHSPGRGSPVPRFIRCSNYI